MSQQPPESRASTGTTYTPLNAATSPSAALPATERPDEQLRLAGAQHGPTSTSSRAFSETGSSTFRAPGVDALLSAPHGYASQANVSSLYGGVSLPSAHQSHVTSLLNSQRAGTNIPEGRENKNGSGRSPIPPSERPSLLPPLQTDSVRTRSSDRPLSSDWLQAAPRSAPPRDRTSSVVRSAEQLSGTAISTASEPSSRDPRGTQPTLPIQPPFQHRPATALGQDSSTSARTPPRRIAEAPPNTRDVSMGGERLAGEDQPSRKRSRDTEHTLSDSGQQHRSRSAGMVSGTQYMTLQTDQGPMSFPVDVQAASRGADEKRKRNAGASARFRARRKEREQASSREIDELRSTIRDLGEEVEFYRRERDYMASVLHQSPDREMHFPRPPSPRRRRLSVQSADAELSRTDRGTSETPAMYRERSERGSLDRQTRQRLSRDSPYDGGRRIFSPLSPPPAQSVYGGQFTAPQQGVNPSARQPGSVSQPAPPPSLAPYPPRESPQAYPPASSRGPR